MFTVFTCSMCTEFDLSYHEQFGLQWSLIAPTVSLVSSPQCVVVMTTSPHLLTIGGPKTEQLSGTRDVVGDPECKFSTPGQETLKPKPGPPCLAGPRISLFVKVMLRGAALLTPGAASGSYSQLPVNEGKWKSRTKRKLFIPRPRSSQRLALQI